MTTRCHCGATTPDSAFLCRSCGDQLARALGDMRSLMHEVSVVATKQARVYRANGRPDPTLADEHAQWADEQRKIPAMLRSREERTTLPSTRLMVDLDARELLWVAGNTLSTWTRHLETDNDHATDANLHAWLCEHVTQARYNEAAAQMYDEITWLHRTLTRAVDRQPSRVFAGPCHAPTVGIGRCQRDLYAHLGAAHIVCDGWMPDGKGNPYDVGCRTVHTPETRREWLIAELEFANVPLNTLKAAIPRLWPGIIMPPDNTWKSWLGARGRLRPSGVDRDGVELFRGGDVLTLVLDQAVRPGPKRRAQAS